MDILLPVINVGVYPNDNVTYVSLYPSQEPITVDIIYSIGDINHGGYSLNTPIKKKSR